MKIFLETQGNPTRKEYQLKSTMADVLVKTENLPPKFDTDPYKPFKTGPLSSPYVISANLGVEANGLLIKGTDRMHTQAVDGILVPFDSFPSPRLVVFMRVQVDDRQVLQECTLHFEKAGEWEPTVSDAVKFTRQFSWPVRD
jgi:hypothetical protein